MSHIVLPYPPSVNRAWRTFRGHAVRSAEANAYRNVAKAQAGKARMELRTGMVELIVILHPKQRKRETAKPVRCMDLDNCLKVAIDALQGIAYTNDSQIVRIVAQKGPPVPCGAMSVEVRAAQ